MTIIVFRYDAGLVSTLSIWYDEYRHPRRGAPEAVVHRRDYDFHGSGVNSRTEPKLSPCNTNWCTLALLRSGSRTGKHINSGCICSRERSMSSRPKVNNFFELVKTARIDQAVGIRIVKVTGDDHRGLYVAELEPHRSVTAHYHRTGTEIYQIIQGEGKIHTGVPTSDDVVVWNTSVDVRSGDCFTVQEGQVHQLENTGSLPMIVIIVCPAAHIGHDRFMVKGAIPH